MSAAPAGTEVPFLFGGPERAFRVGPVTVSEGVFRSSMETGPWVLGPDGRPSFGSLGVLIDVILGYPVVTARPAGGWAVSTEISVDFCAPVPADGSVLQAESRVLHLDSAGGLAEARVLDAAGTVIASGRQRLRFVPGTPVALAAGPLAADTLDSELPARPQRQAAALDQLGATILPTPDGAVLLLPLGPGLANPMGTLHGGIMLCASELAGHAALQRPGSALSTASVHISYLRARPVTGEATFEAVTRHRGRTLGVAEVTSRRADGKICTLATVTCHQAG
jgi:uncharacterized protein (TIGR00369 family)